MVRRRLVEVLAWQQLIKAIMQLQQYLVILSQLQVVQLNLIGQWTLFELFGAVWELYYRFDHFNQLIIMVIRPVLAPSLTARQLAEPILECY